MRTKLFIVTSLFITSVTSFAQSSNVGLSDRWNTLYLQWNPSSFVPEEGSSENFTGLSVGLNSAFSISQKLPLYLETGFGFQYSFYAKEITESVAEELGVRTYVVSTLLRPEEIITMYSAKIPFGLAYAFRIPDTKLEFIPNVGLDLRLNIVGKAKARFNLTSEGISQLKYNGYTQQMINKTFGDREINLFDLNDMGSDAATWNRFQVGWHVGLNARISNIFLMGVSYGTDFSEITQNTKIHTTSLSVGYCF